MSRRNKCIILIGPRAPKLEVFAASELSKHLSENLNVDAEIKRVGSVALNRLAKSSLIILGTAKSNKVIGGLVEKKAIANPVKADGFSIKTISSPYKALVACGVDSRGALYAVRDLCHYHLIKKGAGFIPKLDIKSAPKHIRRGVATWDYYVADPYKYIDMLSEWKQNVFMVGGQQFLLEQPEIFDHAEARGVDVHIAFGIFSWEFTGLTVHRQPSWTPPLPPDYVKLSPSKQVICPSDERSRRWQVDRIIEIIRAMPKIKGFLFQSGILDFPDCSCGVCHTLQPDELFLAMAEPVMEAVYKERPDIFMVHSIGGGQVYSSAFRRCLKHIDQRSQLMIETGAMPTDTDVDTAMKHHFKGGKIIDHVKIYGQTHNGHLMPEWENARRQIFHRVYSSLTRCVEKYDSDTALALLQSRDYGKKDLLEPAFFSETAWHAGVTSESKFMKTIVPRLREICDRDDRHSDPLTTHIAKDNSVLYNKRMIGTYDDWGWIWGQVRICTPLATSHFDLLVESDTAEYNFELSRNCKKGLKSAELIIHGAVAPVRAEKQDCEEFVSKEDKEFLTEHEFSRHRGYAAQATLPFKFDVEINGNLKKNVKSTWKHGERRLGKGTTVDTGSVRIKAKLPHVFLGQSDWTVKLKKDCIKPKTKVKLKLLSDGLVVYEKMTLKLNY
ncbi:hypothetical protein ACFL1X_08330 [Candidatus Hydrogenedentota bacterium]